MKRSTETPQSRLMHIPAAIRARAAEIARQRRLTTGEPASWQSVIREAIESGLPAK